MRPDKRKAAPVLEHRSGKGENSLDSLFSPPF